MPRRCRLNADVQEARAGDRPVLCRLMRRSFLVRVDGKLAVGEERARPDGNAVLQRFDTAAR